MKQSKDFILTTASSIEGYRIIAQLGLVFGETVFKHGYMARYGASWADTVDGLRWGSHELSGSMELIENARQFAYDKMIEDAKSKGANAIIAIDSDNTFGGDVMYISLYGTAVKVVSEAEYEKGLLAEKESQALRKAEAEQKEAEKQKQIELNREKKAAGQFWREERILQEIADQDTVKKIWEIWSSSTISDEYSELTQRIKHSMNSERMYGEMPGEANKIKKEIKVALLGE